MWKSIQQLFIHRTDLNLSEEPKILIAILFIIARIGNNPNGPKEGRRKQIMVHSLKECYVDIKNDNYEDSVARWAILIYD